MPFDYGTLSLLGQRTVRRGTSLFIETYNRSTNAVVDSFEVTNVPYGPVPSELNFMAEARLNSVASAISSAAAPSVAPTVFGSDPWDLGYTTARDAAKAGSGLCRISVITDSIGYGYYASNLDTKSWVGIMKTALQAKYGDGGSGIISVNRSDQILTADSRAAAIKSAWAAAGNLISTTGTWTEVTNGTDGPGGGVLMASTVGATATFVARGSTIEIFYQSVPSLTAAGSFTYQIDGGAVSSAIQSYRASQGALEKITVTGLSSGNHTVVITATDANGTLNFSVCGVSGRNASGIVVDQCSRGGQTSDVLSNVNAKAWTSAGGKSWGGSAQNLRGSVIGWNGGVNRPCDLGVIALGVNDSTTDKTVGSVQDNFRLAMASMRKGNPNCSILVVYSHRGHENIDGTTRQYGPYGNALQDLCRVFNAGFLNLWAAGKNDWDYMVAQNYMSANNTVVGVSGTDGIHLSDLGHAWQGAKVLAALGE